MPSESKKFNDPYLTASGHPRAHVSLKQLDTLWFNTGTVCNLACQHCYIESSPQNDRLSFMTWADVKPYLEEINTHDLGTTEVGFTGGEPFANRYFLDILDGTLAYGFDVLVLSNGYKQLPKCIDSLTALERRHPGKMILRISLDHHSSHVHEQERGPGTFLPAIASLKLLQEHKVSIAVAGRNLHHENHNQALVAYQNLFHEHDLCIDTQNPLQFTMFPEMNLLKDVPEITTACWDILNVSPESMMCANSRMVVKRKDQSQPKVLACTLLAYDEKFEMGTTLKESQKKVQLNHPFCAQFCVLGGASCTAG